MKIRSHILLWIFVSNVGMIKPFPFYSSDLEILQWLSGSEHMELLTKNAIKPNLAQCDLEKYSYWKWHKTAPPSGVFPSCIIIYRNIDRFFVMLRTLENSLIASLTKLEKKIEFQNCNHNKDVKCFNKKVTVGSSYCPLVDFNVLIMIGLILQQKPRPQSCEGGSNFIKNYVSDVFTDVHFGFNIAEARHLVTNLPCKL